MTTPLTESRVVPAQLCFLAIYNPSLGPTDETFKDQVVFYYSRTAKEARASVRRGNQTSESSLNASKEEENERLRQIGLAQGMVDFARTFSNGEPVDSVETEKSRIVIKEVEEGWWVLASIDLTRLPKATPASTPISPTAQQPDSFEYSAREVSPPALLTAQIETAHRTFCLHHGPSLTLLLTRNGREKFCSTLDRFWSRYCRHWDVLLHGNPTTDVLGGIKLSAGGELGMGVGEEEWGSGEREVLEDLVHRTDGLVDLVVSRFGEPTPTTQASGNSGSEQPWMGRGDPPGAEDGLIFGGLGKVSREGLRGVSSWLQQIYVFGDHAYGVKDNPSRKRRRMQQVVDKLSSRDQGATSQSSNRTLSTSRNGHAAQKSAQNGRASDAPSWTTNLPPDLRPSLHDRVASHDYSPGSPADVPNPLSEHRTGIPPPIVTAAEQSLNKALTQAKAHKDAAQQSGETATDQQGSVFGISNDKWVKYLTLGLSEVKKASPSDLKRDRSSISQRQSTTTRASLQRKGTDTTVFSDDEPAQPALQQLEPVPDGYLVESRFAEQRRLETDGYFLIGYRGPLQGAAQSAVNPQDDDEEGGDRTILRTLYVEVVRKVDFEEKTVQETDPDSSSVKTFKNGMTTQKVERLRVVVYIRRPFIYAFLFEQRTESLQMPSFYMGIHQHLAPLLKPLGVSTSAKNVARRIEESRPPETTEPLSPHANATASQSRKPSSAKAVNTPVYDLLYDPLRLTVHSSIPNIPSPGTHAAEGLTFGDGHQSSSTAGPWTRIEGLNVHSQILSTLESTARDPRQIERSTKTSRGWWVVWMRLAPSTHVDQLPHEEAKGARSPSPSAGDASQTASSGGTSAVPTTHTLAEEEFETGSCRVAVVVRKASDWVAPKASGAGSRFGSGMFGIGGGIAGVGGSGGRSDDVTGGSNAGWGSPTSLAGGVGFDARRYVEGLLSLSR